MAAPSADGETRLQIRHLDIVQSPDRVQSPEERGDSIDEFLNCFDTLETLIIYAPDHYAVMASPSSVSKHHNNLRILYLEYGVGVNAWCYPQDELDTCFGICHKIEQLALNFPDMSYLPDYGPDSEEFQSYLVSTQW